MQTDDFDFSFPEALIAYEPLPRGQSKMWVVDKTGLSNTEVTVTSALPQFLNRGDALVLNDTKVLKARLLGSTKQGGQLEALLLNHIPNNFFQSHTRWQAMVKPAKRFRQGEEISFSSRLIAKVYEVLDDGTRVLDFNLPLEEFYSELDLVGKVPLPPYIKRASEKSDDENYQTVFAKNLGSVAAPTASLHISEAMLCEAEARNVQIIKVTLHVGAGTFKPVKTNSILEHKMHSEFFSFSNEAAEKLNTIRKRGGKIWAVGTTAARVLETQAKGSSGLGADENLFVAGSGETNIFIYPGYKWKAVDGLLTNFHWPKSTLFMLVCSLLGIERAKQIYAEAFEKKTRLFSYGDAMLIR